MLIIKEWIVRVGLPGIIRNVTRNDDKCNEMKNVYWYKHKRGGVLFRGKHTFYSARKPRAYKQLWQYPLVLSHSARELNCMTVSNLYRAFTILMKHISQDKRDELVMTSSELFGNQNLKTQEIRAMYKQVQTEAFAASVMNKCMPLVQLSWAPLNSYSSLPKKYWSHYAEYALTGEVIVIWKYTNKIKINASWNIWKLSFQDTFLKTFPASEEN